MKLIFRPCGKGIAFAALMVSCLYATAQSTGVNTIPTPHPLDPATNSTNPSATATQMQNPYLGSVTVLPLQPGSVELSLSDAVQYALRANLGLIDSSEAHTEARAQRLAALSELLPHLEASATEHYMQANTHPTGGQKVGLPAVIGPYSYQAASLEMNGNVLDLRALYRYRSTGHSVAAAEFSKKDSRNIVVLAAASAYIAISASESRVRADQAALDSASALEVLMKDRVEHGVSPKIEWIRAQVAARTARQRLDLTCIQLEKDKFALARVIGFPVEQQIELTTPLSYRNAPDVILGSALQKADENRSDLKAAVETGKAADAGLYAAEARRLPAIRIGASYGTAGTTTAHLYDGYDIGGTVRIPLFTGGEITSDIRQAHSLAVRRKAESEDLRNRVSFDVRSAWLDLEGAERSVSVATQNLDLAKEGLKEAQDRFDVGLSNTLDLVEGQQQQVEAQDNYISSLYAHNLAKLMLIRATGTAEQDLALYVGD
ncbi:MAG: TolC family protein [Terracidiphilus sp.]|nr:TolC family protein [Terracidiphilus sp.]